MTTLSLLLIFESFNAATTKKEKMFFHPTQRGFQISEKDWMKLVEGHFFETLDSQIKSDPR
jgi:hypothetical protein